MTSRTHPSRLGRRSFLRHTALGLGALAGGQLLVGCGPASTAAPAAPPPMPAVGVTPTAPARPEPTGAPTAAPTAAGRGTTRPLVVVMGQQPDTLMPRVGSMLASAEVLAALHTEPVVSDDQGKFVALGVEQVPTLENGGAKWVGEGADRHLEVAFRIKKGLTWHDGTPVMARDMRFHWSLIMQPTFKVDDRSRESKVRAVEVLDDRTAVYRFHSAREARDAAASGFMDLPAADFADWRDRAEPVADPLYMLVGGFLPEHILGKVDPAAIERHEFARKPVLCGPYRFREWVPDQSITLEALPDHVLGAPKIPTVVFRIIKDTNAQLAALQAGEIDVVTQVQGIDVGKAPDLDRIASQGRFAVHYLPSAAWEHVDFNLDNEHLKEKNVRKAIAYGINREQIVERVLNGKSTVAHSWVQPGLPPWAYDDSCLVAYSYDAGKAKELLQAAGYAPGPDGILAKGGKKLQLTLSTTDQALRKATAQVIQAQLKQIGIGLELEFLPGQAFFDAKGAVTRRTFQLAMYTWTSEADPNREDYMHSKNIPSEQNDYAGNNYPGYRNPKVDELATKGASTIDETERKPIYCQLQQIWTDDLPVLPLFRRAAVSVRRTGLRNFRPTPSSTPETWNIHEWALT